MVSSPDSLSLVVIRGSCRYIGAGVGISVILVPLILIKLVLCKKFSDGAQRVDRPFVIPAWARDDRVPVDNETLSGAHRLVSGGSE
jgi:hypothetical protein